MHRARKHNECFTGDDNFDKEDYYSDYNYTHTRAREYTRVNASCTGSKPEFAARESAGHNLSGFYTRA